MNARPLGGAQTANKKRLESGGINVPLNVNEAGAGLNGGRRGILKKEKLQISKNSGKGHSQGQRSPRRIEKRTGGKVTVYKKAQRRHSGEKGK